MREKSLAEESGTLTAQSAFEMPAIFQEPNEKVVGKFNAPYLTFAHKERQDEWAKLNGQGVPVNEGDMFLIEPYKITKLEVAKVNVLKVKQYWVLKDSSGKVLKSSYTEMPWSQNEPWSEHMDCVVFVHMPNGIVVANVNPHTTKCAGFKALSDAMNDCQKPEWADRSPAHKETLQINQPFMRFFGELTVAPARISRKSGRPYRVTNCVIKPTTNTEANLLKQFSEDMESGKRMADAAERFKYRMQDIDAVSINKKA